jgi:hypothetical protein
MQTLRASNHALTGCGAGALRGAAALPGVAGPIIAPQRTTQKSKASVCGFWGDDAGILTPGGGGVLSIGRIEISMVIRANLPRRRIDGYNSAACLCGIRVCVPISP